jgi:hypothetical protein
VKAEIKPVRTMAPQLVNNEPVFVRDEKDAARLDHFINRTPRLAAKQVEARSRQALD